MDLGAHLTDSVRNERPLAHKGNTLYFSELWRRSRNEAELTLHDLVLLVSVYCKGSQS